MSEFFLTCALANPSTSLRKSAWRSLQRMPPLATRPKRTCRASNQGHHTKVSAMGWGAGKKGMEGLANLREIVARDSAQLVRVVASRREASSCNALSCSRSGTVENASSIDARASSTEAPDAGHKEGDKQAHSGQSTAGKGHQGTAHGVGSLRRPRPTNDPAVGAVRAEQGHLAPIETGPDDEAVERAELPPPAQHGVEGVHQAGAVPERVEHARLHQRGVDPQADVVHVGVRLTGAELEVPRHRFHDG